MELKSIIRGNEYCTFLISENVLMQNTPMHISKYILIRNVVPTKIKYFT